MGNAVRQTLPMETRREIAALFLRGEQYDTVAKRCGIGLSTAQKLYHVVIAQQRNRMEKRLNEIHEMLTLLTKGAAHEKP